MALSLSDEQKIYESIKKHINIKKIKEMYPNITVEDLDMCIASSIYDSCDNMRIKVMDTVYGANDEKEVGKDIIKTIKDDILDDLGYFYRIRHEYNERFNNKRSQYELEFNFYDNPFLLTQRRFDNQFENFEQDSEEQIYAKAIFWSNNVSKQLEVIKKNIVNGISEKKETISIMSKLDKECKLKMVDKKYNLRDEFIVLYKRYLEEDIEKEELENDDVYLMMKSCLEKNEESLEISPEEAFKFFSINSCIQSMYRIKDIYIEKIISMYSKLEKDESKNGRLKIYQCENDNKKSRLMGKNKKQLLTILVKDTNTPIKVHVPKEILDEVEDIYDIEIPQGEIDLEYRNLMFLKYDKKQQEQIKKLNDAGIKSFLDWDVREYIEKQYNMCNRLDEIEIGKQKKNR